MFANFAASRLALTVLDDESDVTRVTTAAAMRALPGGIDVLSVAHPANGALGSSSHEAPVCASRRTPAAMITARRPDRMLRAPDPSGDRRAARS